SVTVDDASKTNATATFSAPGDYVLMLSANDGIHAIAYDAMHVKVASDLTVAITQSQTAAQLTWNGSPASFVVEQTRDLSAPQWTPVLTTSVFSASFPFTNPIAFYRIRE